MALSLYDTNNWARIKFEVDPTGIPLRRMFSDAFYAPVGVFFFDGFKAKELRKAIYPAYKSKRVAASDNFYVMLGAFKELLTHTHHVIVDVPGYEADDVIATYCKSVPTMEIEIHSTDRDFCALHRPGLTTPIANLKGVEAHHVRLYKTLCGDTTDTIPGLVKFGDGAWKTLTDAHRAKWIEHLEGVDCIESELGLSKPVHVANWKRDMELLRTYWKIIGFYDVPTDLIAKHTRVGKPNYARADAILKELLQ